MNKQTAKFSHSDRANSLFIAVIFLLILLFNSFLSQQIHRPSLEIDAELRRQNFTFEFLNILNLGQKRMIASFFWMETLLNADHEDYDGEGLSWMGHRFNNIVSLDPSFYDAYLTGTQFLHVLKGEFEAAANLARRGLHLFPDDYWLHYHLAFILNIELNRPDESLPYYHFLIEHERSIHTPMIYSIYLRLQSNESALEEAIQHLQSFIDQLTPDNFLYQFYQEKIEELKGRENQ